MCYFEVELFRNICFDYGIDLYVTILLLDEGYMRRLHRRKTRNKHAIQKNTSQNTNTQDIHECVFVPYTKHAPY